MNKNQIANRNERIKGYIEQALREQALLMALWYADNPQNSVFVARVMDDHANRIASKVFHRLNDRVRMSDRNRGG